MVARAGKVLAFTNDGIDQWGSINDQPEITRAIDDIEIRLDGTDEDGVTYFLSLDTEGKFFQVRAVTGAETDIGVGINGNGGDGGFLLTLVETSGDYTYISGTPGLIQMETHIEGGASTHIDIRPDGMKITGLPTSDPVGVGLLWNDSGTLKISAG